MFGHKGNNVEIVRIIILFWVTFFVYSHSAIAKKDPTQLLFPQLHKTSGLLKSPFKQDRPKTHTLPRSITEETTGNKLLVAYIRILNLPGKHFFTMIKHNKKHFLSTRGLILFDQRTNTLIIHDTQQSINRIKALLRHLDVPLKEVLINARIVVVDQKALDELGVSINAIKGSTANASINAPILNPTGTLGLSIGQLPLGFRLDLELQALQSEGDSDVLSSPEVMVINGQKAIIEQGKEVPFNTATSDGATQVEFKKAVLGLTVIPIIKPNNKIVMQLTVNNDAISHHFGRAGTIPIIDTTSLSTHVIVTNGQTVVLGGIYLTLKQNNTTQVPILGRIPILGRFFSRKSHSNHQTELLVFLCPKIIR